LKKAENGTTAFYEFENGQWYQFRLCVSDNRIMVWFHMVDEEGNNIVADKDDPKTASLNKFFKKKDFSKKSLFLSNNLFKNLT